MKKLLLIILFITVKAGLAQSNDTLNFTDPTTGLKQGHWIYKGKDKNLPNYQPEAPVEDGKYIDSRKNGVWITYWPNGNKKSEITFNNNTAKGYAKMYYEDGKLSEEGNWENQRWTGSYKMYHPNGATFYEFNYNKSGKREGKQTYFYDNGKVMMSGDMKDGKEAGTWDGYYENGDLKDKKGFNNGVLDPTQVSTYAPRTPEPPKKQEVVKGPPSVTVDPKKNVKNGGDPIPFFTGNGPAKLYNLNRQISQDGTFKNYKLIEGKNYVYSKDGILLQIAVYKNGMYVGDAPIEDEKK